MTRTTMLAIVRTLLDESSAGFFTDTEIYQALQDGEYDALNNIISVYNMKREINPNLQVFDVLRPLIGIVTNTAFGTTGIGVVALPTDFFYDLHVEYSNDTSTPQAAYRRGENPNRYFSRENTYLPSDQLQFYYWIDAGLNFETTIVGTGSYRLNYIKKPTGISASQDAMIGFQAHEAICYYAFARMLIKDQRDASQAFSIYMRLLQQVFY